MSSSVIKSGNVEETGEGDFMFAMGFSSRLNSSRNPRWSDWNVILRDVDELRAEWNDSSDELDEADGEDVS